MNFNYRCKFNLFLLGFGFFTHLLIYSSILSDSALSQAQIQNLIPSINSPIPDRTLPQNSTVINNQPNLFQINGGTSSGTNLFHSFQSFSIPSGTTVQFNNSTQINNIISRVTGNQISQLNGTLAANGNANFFLINPNGIQFGKEAQLNLGGALVLSTANQILFGDRLSYSAVNTSEPLLSVNVPLGLQFNHSVAEIKVNGVGRDITTTDGRFIPSTTLTQANQQFLGLKPNQAIALVGGNILLDGGLISAPSGKIELGAVKNGTVTFDRNLQFDYQNVQQFGDLKLANQSLVDASGVGIGQINLQANNIELIGGARILSQNQGADNGSRVQLNAKGDINVIGSSPAGGFNVSAILLEGLGTGSTGELQISAQNLTLANGGSIAIRGFNLSPGGNANIAVANQTDISGSVPGNPVAASSLGVLTFGAANGGNLNIDTNRLAIADGANLNTATFSSGDGGNFKLNARAEIEVRGVSAVLPSGIVANTFNRGNGGNLEITTPKLSVLGGARVGASTAAFGKAGNLIIRSTESVEVRGNVPNLLNPSLIDSSANIVDPATQAALGLPPFPTGDAGSVSISSPSLIIADSGTVSVRNDGTGSAGRLQINSDATTLSQKANISAVSNSGAGGKITIDTQTLSLENSGIASSSLVSGRGADIEINASKSVAIAGNGLENLLESIIPFIFGIPQGADPIRAVNGGVLTSTFGTGKSGNLSITTPKLSLTNGSFITTASVAQGDAGDISLRAVDTLSLTDSIISTNTSVSGKGGQLNVEAGKVVSRGGGVLTSSTIGSGNAGNISVVATELIDFSGAILNVPLISGIDLDLRAGLAASSSLGTGASGSLTVSSPQISLNDNAGISTSSFSFSDGGSIKLTTESLSVTNNARIAGQSLLGGGGNVDLTASKSILLRQAQITAAAGSESFGGGDGGNIKINSPLVLLLNNAQINANAFLGAGGNVDITTQGLLSDRNSQINASSRLGLDGIVQINSPDLDPNSGLVKLPDQVTDNSNLISLGCAAKPGSLVLSGSGGLPANAAENLRLSSLQTNPTLVQSSPKLIQEATNWQKTATGKISLTTSAPRRVAALPPNCLTKEPIK